MITPDTILPTAVGQSRGTITGICRLCQRPNILKKSHIQSKFIWRDSGIIGGNRSFAARCENRPELSKRNQHDGFKERLLCGDCEEHFGRYENYAKPMLFGPTSPIMVRPAGHHVWTGLNYKLMKLFQMSILWRMVVSADPYYAFAVLPAEEEETLRKMLLADEPGEPWQYGCLVTTLRLRGKPLLGFFTQPCKIPVGGDAYLRLVLAGMQWHLYLGSAKPKEMLCEGFLSRAGTWALLQGEAEDFEYLRFEIADYKKWLLAEARRPL
jgi:hypothetical protein